MDDAKPVLTNHGQSKDGSISFAVIEDPNLGPRKSMEDFTIAEPDLLNDGQFAFFAVLDGHGGTDIAAYVQHNFAHILRDCLSDAKTKASGCQALALSFQLLEKNLINLKDQDCGSTFCGVLIDFLTKKYHIANIGDSKLVQAFRGTQQDLELKAATIEHKITNENERARVKAVNGLFNNRVGGQLLVTRALGDFAFKQYGLTAEPDLFDFQIKNEEFILIGSDGIWDAIELEATRDLLTKNRKEPTASLAMVIAEEAKTKSIDNMSLIVVHFK